ncbi:MAG: hypothetical protein CR977_00465 [Gammaproteobacteria bacterium]|nr:MAG: hypothetical protein CR977_00465 [Gammaproteobacteria bacterium]
MMNDEQQQAIALAATVQALSIVHDVASQGRFDEYQALPLLQSLVTYNPKDTLSAYGGNITALQTGMGQVKKLFGDNPNRDIAQYLLAALSIELKLVRDQRMRQILQRELQQLAQQVQQAAATETGDEDTIAGINDNELPASVLSELAQDVMMVKFAEIYKQTASRTEPRIMIKGNHQFLQQETSANQIRAMLLAALRGAAFFRHYGGKRFDLMMKRARYIEIFEQL